MHGYFLTKNGRAGAVGSEREQVEVVATSLFVVFVEFELFAR